MHVIMLAVVLAAAPLPASRHEGLYVCYGLFTVRMRPSGLHYSLGQFLQLLLLLMGSARHQGTLQQLVPQDVK